VKPRIGNPVRLPFAQSSFTDVISLKAKHISHSGAMGAHGFLLCLQWVLRSKSRFSSRVVIGIDAKVVLHAAIKGRSSSPTLSSIIRSIAAHCLAGDLLLYPLYVPSESNPADAPSRGRRRRPPQRRSLQTTRHNHFDKRIRKLSKAWERFRETGMLGNGSSSTCSSSL
jgi:hypothetical protein